jgi:hypothetical protein
MGKWLNLLRRAEKAPADRTDKTDETTSAKVLSVLAARSDGVSNKLAPCEEGGADVSVGLVGSPSDHFHDFRAFNGWDDEDWQAAFDERAAILEFDHSMHREDAERLAWRQIEAERKRSMQ